MNDSEQLAIETVRSAISLGATDAEVTIAERDELSVNVRMGEIERLKQAGSRGIGLRVLIGKCVGSSYTSDLSEQGIEQMIRSALGLARISSEDPFAGLPDESELGEFAGTLNLYCEDVARLDPQAAIRMASEAEAAALGADPRIANSEGGAFLSYQGRTVFANSRGFAGSYRMTRCSLSAVPVAREGEWMERDYWMSAARSIAALESPEQIGRAAAKRALRRLGAKKVQTQRVPIVFEPRAAGTLLANLFDAVNGQAVYRNASFLAGHLGERVASAAVTVIDDSTMPGLFGSSPFDDEGVPSRRTPVVEDGVLKSWLLNSYTARKLGLKTTGNATRGLGGNPTISHGNFYLKPADTPSSAIIGSIADGFYVTELMGFGVNTVTGDYSRGATGLWIRGGELAFPVSGVTIAGNLRQMLSDIEAIGSDLEFRSAVAAPTLLIREMTVAGN